MKRILLAALVLPAAFAVALLAGHVTTFNTNLTAASDACGTGTTSTVGTGTGTTGAGGGGCCDSGSYLSVPDRLYGVAGTSASDVWAVGLEPTATLIMHWNGCSWQVSYDRPVGYFTGVSAVSASDAWAVGGTNWFSPSQPLAEHWNGSSWTEVAAPTPDGSAILTSVAATSASNAWAVGMIGPGPGVRTYGSPLIEHWDGTAWSVQSFPEPEAGGQFHAVAADGPDDAWAVGWTGGTGEGSGQTTLIDHWDGSSWTQVPSPDPAGDGNTLQGVTVISPDDAWAVGYTMAASGVYNSLTMHWDGTSWSVVSSPDPTGDTVLNSVTAASSDDAWAVGYTNPTRCGHGPACGTVAMHWNGSSWTVATTPDPSSSYLNDFLGVTALSRDDVWAVGTTDYASTLISHWDGSGWH